MKSNYISGKDIHELMISYNWDDGFNLPSSVIENEKCDLGTAILCFYSADGYTYLCDLNDINLNEYNREWFHFVDELYKGIKEGKYTAKDIHYKPDLTKVQKYKLRKMIRDIPEVILEGI